MYTTHAQWDNLPSANFRIMDDLAASEFFGFVPEQLYHEIYAVGYNEFLAAVSSLRRTLLSEFPEKQQEVEEGCRKLLESYSERFDQRFTKLVQYLSKNIFLVPRHVPVYNSDLAETTENKEALFRVKELRYRIMATEYLNTRLLELTRELDAEIAKRKDLLADIAAAKEKADTVKKVKEMERKLREAVHHLQSD